MKEVRLKFRATARISRESCDGDTRAVLALRVTLVERENFAESGSQSGNLPLQSLMSLVGESLFCGKVQIMGKCFDFKLRQYLFSIHLATSTSEK